MHACAMFKWQRPVTDPETAKRIPPGQVLTETPLDIHRVPRWSKLDTPGQGVAMSHIAEVAQPRPGVRFVIFHAEYGFTSNVPLEVALDPAALLAWNFDGKPLEAEPGYPPPGGGSGRSGPIAAGAPAWRSRSRWAAA